MIVERRGRFLVVQFPVMMRVLSWAIRGGGFRRSRMVTWFQVQQGELTPKTDPASLLRKRLKEANLAGSVGMMTGTALDRYVHVERSLGPLMGHCIVTVGLSNALAIGDSPTLADKTGTVNLLVHVSIPLSRGAMVEAVSLAAEARTSAFLESHLISPWSGKPATGTGTDCIVIASPFGRTYEKYSGKHTVVGSLIGQTVKDAVLKGIQDRLRGE